MNDLLPAFCNDPKRGYDIAGFQQKSLKPIQNVDAENFIKGLDAGLVQVDGNMYRARRSSAREQLFTEGWKSNTPRRITVWAESVIIIATLARLHFSYSWPADLLGTQSRDGAFDIMTFVPPDFANEFIACEVKKSTRELAKLIQWMNEFGAEPSRKFKNDAEENAFNKVVGLRLRHAPIFWAVGPGGTGTVFKVSYTEDGQVNFEEAPLTVLQYAY
ncbi:hypothetical protein [Sphingomonas sp.]|uniref:hypothetical protein n=1 Tax=Sphingomonas sp. TaxID=28214 RepID=UPI003B00FFA2